MRRAGNFTILGVFILVSLIVYFNSLSNPFQYDDEYYVVDNHYIRDISNIKNVFLQPKMLVQHGWPSGHYRPLVFASYALNYYIGGLNPVDYHIVNLAFHAGSAFLVFLIVGAMPGGGGTPIKGYTMAAIAAGLIFLVHPFNSEVVNYITARSSVMCGFFYLLAFWCWVKYRKQNQEILHSRRDVECNDSSRCVPYYIASLLTFLLAMLTKEVAVTLPAVLFLYDLYFRGGGKRGAREYVKGLAVYLPFVLVVAVPYFILRIFFWGAALPRFQRNILVQIYTGLPVLVKQLRLFLLPTGLSVDHYIKIYQGFFDLPVIGSYVLLMSILLPAVWLYFYKRTEWRVVSFFIIWFFIVLMPTTIFPLNTILQENRGYLAAVSFAVSAGILLAWALRPFRSVRPYIIISGLLIAVYSTGTIYRNSVWGDELALWNDAIAKGSGSLIAYTHLSKAYILRGEYAKGEEILKRLLRQFPDDFYTHYNLSMVYYKTGRVDMALEEALTALKLFPSNDAATFMVGFIANARGDKEMALRYYNMTLEVHPLDPEAHFNIGSIHQEEGRLDAAAFHYSKVVHNIAAKRELAEVAEQRLKKLEGKGR